MRNAFLRMRQISSGFVGYYDDDHGSRAEYSFPYNPKLELLMTLIQSIREDRKIVVCLDFIWSGDRIEQELKELQIGYVRVSGTTKDPAAALSRFDNDRRVRVMLLSNSMVFGLNLQIAKYLIFYESPVPVITRKQAERRIERQESQHSKVFVYDLLVRGTVDERILAFHKQGKDLFRAIIDGKERI
jgi:SNF2 family DNA or RNA helicase